MYLDPTELDSLLETSSLVIMLIAIIDILVRILLFQPAENGSKINLLDRLKRVDEVYPMGPITFAGFFVGLSVVGFLYLPTDRHNPKSVIFSGGIILSLSLLLIEWINRKAGKKHQEHVHPKENLVVGKKEPLLFQRRPSRRWSSWMTLLGAIVFTFLTYNLLSFTMSQVPGRQLFILVFVEIYALLAWIRWMETRGYKYGGSEG
jgi:drug/metabolite transporter (DMT)-like permease